LVTFGVRVKTTVLGIWAQKYVLDDILMKKYYLIVVEGSQEVKKLRPSRKKIVS